MRLIGILSVLVWVGCLSGDVLAQDREVIPEPLPAESSAQAGITLVMTPGSWIECSIPPGEDQAVMVEFDYRFEGDPNALLEVSVHLGGADEVHAVARVHVPAQGRAGAPDGTAPARFRARLYESVWDWSGGGVVSVSLLGPAESRCFVSEVTCEVKCVICPVTLVTARSDRVRAQPGGPQPYCSFICGDFTADNAVSAADYLMLVSRVGSTLSDGIGCMDLGGDGYVDLADVLAYDRAFHGLNVCESPLLLTEAGFTEEEWPAWPRTETATWGPLVLAGKPVLEGDQEDLLFVTDTSGAPLQSPLPALPREPQQERRAWGRLVRDARGRLYQIHGVRGLVDLQDGSVRVPAAVKTVGALTVQVGQLDNTGLSLTDAVFDPCDPSRLYVVPVAVTPEQGCAYRAAAQLYLDPNGGYRITQLYGKNPADDPDVTVRGASSAGVLLEPDVQQLREIEVDAKGNVYVLSTQQINDNDWVLIYDKTIGNASERRVSLSDTLEGPSALLVSASGETLYMTAADSGQSDPNATLYRFAIDREEGKVPGLTFAGTISIEPPFFKDLEPIYSVLTALTEDPASGTVFIAGFSVPDLSGIWYFTDWDPLFTRPMLATITSDSSPSRVTAVDLTDSLLALPLSVMWMGVD